MIDKSNTEFPFIKSPTDAHMEALRREERGTFFITAQKIAIEEDSRISFLTELRKENTPVMTVVYSNGVDQPPKTLEFQLDMATRRIQTLSELFDFTTFRELLDSYERTLQIDFRPISKDQLDEKVRHLPSEPLPVFKSLKAKILQDSNTRFKKHESLLALEQASRRLSFATDLQDESTKMIIFEMLNVVLKNETISPDRVSTYDDFDISQQMMGFKAELIFLCLGQGVDERAIDTQWDNLLLLVSSFTKNNYDLFDEKFTEELKQLLPHCDLEKARRLVSAFHLSQLLCESLRERLPNTIELLIEQNLVRLSPEVDLPVAVNNYQF